MSHYIPIIRREFNPNLSALREDMKNRKNPDFFWPNGTQIYAGWQGSGKTISAVKHAYNLKIRYPKAVLVTNLELNVPFKYVHFSSVEELKKVLVSVNNGFYGVIYLIDEIHTYFNALESKNVPMYVFTEISQQRKQRKCIIGTSQLFTRLAKPFREQCDSLIMCRTKFGVFTTQVAYDGQTLEVKNDGSLSGTVKKRGFFFQTSKLRNLFDTYQKVISGSDQYGQEHNTNIDMSLSGGRKSGLTAKR